MKSSLPEPPGADPLEQFVASVAHDFNNLLTGILGNLELMQNRAVRSGVREFDGYLDGARNAGARAAAFSQRLLAFSGRGLEEVAEVDLNALLREVGEMVRARGVDVRFSLAAREMWLRCDASQAELALNELLQNAVEAVAQGGEVAVRIEDIGLKFRLLVEDTGTGMVPEVLARAMEPFFSTRPNSAGRGLGLPIARRFAAAAGGTLTLASEPGKGTTVTLLFSKLG